MLRTFAIAFVLALAPAAHAASLPQLRADVASVDSKAAFARTSRLELQKSLDEVARQIEAIKAKAAGALFGNAELDGLLKRSQELSSRVTDALRAENEADEALRGGQSRLVNELDQELSRLRARWDAARTREERQGLLNELKALRAERDSLRRAMPATAVPHVSDRPSDDPEVLLERADALYDGEDKLRREEKALAARIEELKQEKDIQRRMDEFTGEDSLFDEHDRLIRAVRPTPLKMAGAAADHTTNGAGEAGMSPAAPKNPGDAAPPATSPSSYSGTQATSDNGRSAAPPAFDPAGAGSKTASGAGSTGFGSQAGADPVAPAATHVGVTRTPPERRAGLAPYSEDESLEELAARRLELKKLADDMHQKAAEAAQKAKSLR